ncbi:MAG: type 1 glutamine amidotransferase [Dermatophilaceae bacterium]
MTSGDRAQRDAAVLVVEHEADVDAALIGERLAAAGLRVETVGPDRRREVPRSLAGVDGLVVLGGSMDPDDDVGAPWLPAVRDLLRQAILEEVPTLAVCLGAQLLGMAVGGRVRRIPDGPEVGLVPIRPSSGDSHRGPLLSHADPDDRALAWHWWEVTDLPRRYRGRPVEVLARSDRCPIQAFVVGEIVWGLQFHLEARARTARAWAHSDPDRLLSVSIDPDRLVAEVAAAEEPLVHTWSGVIDAWITMVGRAAAPTN